MKRVNVYQINHQTKEVALSCDHVNFYDLPGMAYGPELAMWRNPPRTDQMVRSSQRILQVREDGKDAYIACSPELESMLLHWADDSVKRKIQRQAEDIEELKRRLHVAIADRESHHSERVRAQGTSAATLQRIWNFQHAPLLSRIWRAITRAI